MRRWQVTGAWLELVDAMMASQGETVESLAAMIGAPPTLVSGLLSGSSTRSPYVPAICEALGLPFPYEQDARLRKLVEVGIILRERSPRLLDSLIRLAQGIAEIAPKSA